MIVKTRAEGRDVEMTMVQTVDLTQKVQSVGPNGQAKVLQQFERWRLTMDRPTGKIEIDSKEDKVPEGPVGEALSPILKSLIGAEFTMTMDARGVIANIIVPKALVTALTDNPTPCMEDLFSEEGLKRLISQSGLILPPQAAVRGSSWNQKADLKMSYGVQKMATVYTYEGPTQRAGRNLEQVTFKIDLKLEPDPEVKIDVKFKVNHSKGTALFDNESGRLAEKTAEQILTLDVTLGEQAFQQRIEASASMKLKD
jgi:hypothetical protein